jgi:hypothetical protein
VPSPKAEPIKQRLAKVGAQRVEQAIRPLEVVQLSTERAALVKPSSEAPALAWADYYEQLAVLFRRQAAYEAQLVYVDARLEELEAQIGELHSRIESLEVGQRLLPEFWSAWDRRPLPRVSGDRHGHGQAAERVGWYRVRHDLW